MLDAVVALLPVLGFLAILRSMDSFKLVRLGSVVRMLLAGAALAHLGALVHGWLLHGGRVSATVLAHFVAPVTEETLKALPVLYLVLRKRFGFLVDASILGFAVGTGFALVENVEYLLALGEHGVLLWIVRGFGTAVLHGGTTSMLAVLSKAFQERHPRIGGAVLLPGLACAMAVHALFNHLVLPPMVMTILLFVTFPVLIVLVFTRSERATREWLGTGFDSDVEMLQETLSRDVTETPVGRYLLSLKSRFPGDVVADMICLLQIRMELSIRAKGILMAREAGIAVPMGEDAQANVRELRYLERSIGRTGLLALQPLLPGSGRDAWQIEMLANAGNAARR